MHRELTERDGCGLGVDRCWWPSWRRSPQGGLQGQGDQPQFLVVLHAQGGGLSRAGQGERLSLALEGVSPQAVAFTDRPQRIAAAVPARKLVDSWAQRYRGAPPNAALTLLNGKPGADTIVLELTSPTRAGGRLRFMATRVPVSTPGFRPFRAREDGRVPPRFGQATLFGDIPQTRGKMMPPRDLPPIGVNIVRRACP
jgi:hypothetical protein